MAAPLILHEFTPPRDAQHARLGSFAGTAKI